MRIIDKEISEKVINTWRPIIEKALPDVPEYILIEICKYCDYRSGLVDSGSNEYDNNFISLQVLSKLNLEGKTVLATTSPRINAIDNNGDVITISIGTYEERVPIDLNEHLSSDDYARIYSDFLIDKIAASINNRLKYYDTIVIYDMVRIEPITFSLLGRYRVSFQDRNNVPMPKYQIIRIEGMMADIIEVEQDYKKFTSEDGEVLWVNKDGKITSEIYSEDELHRLIFEMEMEINGNVSMINKIREVL